MHHAALLSTLPANADPPRETAHADDDPLLFFVDVDMSITTEFLRVNKT